MFFKKEEKPMYSREETIIEQKLKDLNVCRAKLMGNAVSAYVINASLCCYILDSPDYEKTKNDLKNSQEEIRNIMAHYDELRNDIIQLINKYDLFYHVPATSHTVIETGIRNFIGK